jgi:phosphate transport system substrate-binding protein
VFSGGAHTTFVSTFVDDPTPITYRPRTLNGSRAMHDFVQATPAAFAYIDNAFTEGLHIVPFEGITCSRATIASGAYPARKPLGFVTRGRPRGELARFIRWIKTSPKARKVISTRYVPVR